MKPPVKPPVKQYGRRWQMFGGIDLFGTHACRAVLFRAVLVCAVVFCTLLVGMPQVHAQDAASLQARHAALHAQLASNPFQRPLYLESLETNTSLRGDVYAQIEQPYAVVGPALLDANHWCDILILHLNVKGCRASFTPTVSTLRVHIGRKFDQPLTDAFEVSFIYHVVATTSDYLKVELNAERGPLSTSDYRIALEVVPLDATHSFLHLSYSYAYGLAARIAMRGYLATLGRSKVGFSIVGHTQSGEPIYLTGVRSVVERNTMRYFLAIESYLGALVLPQAQQPERRINAWYDAIEAYPLQLHELERGEYLDMKRHEIRRQQTPGQPTPK